jgi:hypothetical protein
LPNADLEGSIYTLAEYESTEDLNDVVYSENDAVKFYFQDDNWEAFDNDYHYSVAWNDVKDYMTSKIEKAIIQFGNENIHDAEDWDYEENGEFTDAEDVFDNFEEIKTALGNANADGYRVGTENEAWKTLLNSVSRSEEGFWIDMSDHPFELHINENNFWEFLKEHREEIEYQGDLLAVIKEAKVFEFDVPYYGFSDFDEEAFAERAIEEINEL